MVDRKCSYTLQFLISNIQATNLDILYKSLPSPLRSKSRACL